MKKLKKEELEDLVGETFEDMGLDEAYEEDIDNGDYMENGTGWESFNFDGDW